MILAIETSTPKASLALYSREEDAVVWAEDFASERAHNAVIFEPLGAALEQAGGRLETIVVGTGPGSYGGVRVGIAVAHGVALATGARVMGWPSLTAIEAGAGEYAVAGDARRASWYLATVSRGRMMGEPVLMSREALERDIAALVAAGTPVFATAAIKDSLPGVEVRTPQASVLAQRAAALTDDEVESLARRPLEPLYLRAPHITTPRKRTAQ